MPERTGPEKSREEVLALIRSSENPVRVPDLLRAEDENGWFFGANVDVIDFVLSAVDGGQVKINADVTFTV